MLSGFTIAHHGQRRVNKKDKKKKKEKLCNVLLDYIILCFGISLKQQFEENGVICLLHCLQPDNTRIHKVPHTVKQIGKPPYSLDCYLAIFTSLVTKRHSMRTPLLIG
jgi:hypothetical protein